MAQAEVRADERVRANMKLERVGIELSGVDAETLRAADPDVLRDFAQKYFALTGAFMTVQAEEQAADAQKAFERAHDAMGDLALPSAPNLSVVRD